MLLLLVHSLFLFLPSNILFRLVTSVMVVVVSPVPVTTCQSLVLVPILAPLHASILCSGPENLLLLNDLSSCSCSGAELTEPAKHSYSWQQLADT